MKVSAPDYVRVQVTATINPIPGIDEEPLRQKILRRIYGLFHPIDGGFQGRGWRIGQRIRFGDVEDLLIGFLGSEVRSFRLEKLQFGEDKV